MKDICKMRGDLKRLKMRMMEVQRTAQGFDKLGEPRLAEANYQEYARLGRRLKNLSARINLLERDFDGTIRKQT